MVDGWDEQAAMVAELRAQLTAVIAEVRAELDSDHWRLVQNPRMVHAAHAAAGLAHCCALAEEMTEAHVKGSEMAGRILARAAFEAWATALYIAFGGENALVRIARAYVEALGKQAREVRQHDDRVAADRRKARRSNRRIDKRNAGIRAYNERHPHEQKPLLQRVPEPAASPIGLANELERRVPTEFEPQPLPLPEILAKLQELTREAGLEETFEAAYHLAYRGLSTLGAHTTQFVLNSYIDTRGGTAILMHISPQPNPPSFEVPDLQMTLLMVSALSEKVLGDRGAECEAAKAAKAYVTDLVKDVRPEQPDEVAGEGVDATQSDNLGEPD